MDPLSITASIIALIGAGNQLARGINKLASLRGAPASILSLNNELSDIRLVLAETEALLAEHEARDAKHASSISRPRLEKRLFPSLKSVWDRMQELQAIEKRLTTKSGGIDRLAWLWEQDNVNKAQKGLRAGRSDVVAVLGLISSKSTFRIETQLQEVHSATAEGNTSISQSINQQTQTLREILEIQQRNEIYNKGVQQIEKQERPVVQEVQRYSDGPGSLFENTGFSALRMRFLRRRKCQPWCACRCHSHIRFNTPQFLQSVIGQLFVGYTGLPAIMGSCDLPADTCQGTGQSFMQINYYFPTWFLSQALAFSLRTAEFQRPEHSLRMLNVRSPFESIFVGVGFNDAALVRSVIANNRGSVLDVTDRDGHSALHLAVQLSHVESIKVLLEMGAEPYLENTTQETPYDMAWSTIICFQDTPNAAAWRVEEMRTLFPSFDPIEERRRFTRIHKLVNRIIHGSLEKELCRSREMINYADADGRTALSYAAARGDSVALNVLLRFGADPNIADRVGQGPLRQSMKAHDSTCTTMLLHAGARVDHRDNWEQTALITAAFHPEPLPFISTLLLAGADINAADFQRSTILIEAMKRDSFEAVRLLLDHDVHVNEVDSFGMSAFMYGIRHNSHGTLNILLNSGIHVIHSGADTLGKTVLHWAAECADIETLKILTNTCLEGLRISDKTNAGLTAIDLGEKRRELDRLVDELSWTDNKWLDAFRGLLESIKIPTQNSSPRSLRSLGSDISDDDFHDALQHLSFEAVSELAEEGGIRHPA